MPIRLKQSVDILAELKNRGYSTYRLRQDKLIAEDMLTKIRKGQMVSLKVLDSLCKLLECQPGDLIEYVSEED